MVKITLAVCKVYKNAGRFRTHRKRTKKAWKHCFVSDDNTEELTFGTEWVDSITAQFLKLKKLHKRWFFCPECRQWFFSYVKNDRESPDCPYCEEDE